MKQPTVYTCIGYIGLSPTGSGVYYPLFKANEVNVSFVQELGRDGEIADFLPFYDHDSFAFFPSLSARTCRRGDPGIYAFRNVDKALTELSHDEVGPLVRLNDPLVSDDQLPLLTRLALSRIGQAAQAKQISLLEGFVSATINRIAVAKIAVAAHSRTARDQSAWWDRYLAEEKPPQPSNPFREMESEDLFRWLYAHPLTDDWTLGLATLMRRVLYDQRLFDLLVRMLTSDTVDFREASDREVMVIGRGLELYSVLESSDDDFADAMVEHVVSGEIFSLSKVVPPDAIIKFVEQLETNNKLDTPTIDVFLDYLGSEVIDSAVAYALIFRVIESPLLRAPYSSRTYFAGSSRLDRLKLLIETSGRLGLVVDARTRRNILRMSD